MRILLYSVFFFLSTLCFSQTVADDLFSNFEYKLAAQEYKKLDELTLNQKENLAYCYYLAHQYAEAEELYNKIISEDTDEIFHYFLAVSQKNQLKLDAAKQSIKKYLSLDSTDVAANLLLKKIAFLDTAKLDDSYLEIISLNQFNNGAASYGFQRYKNGFLYNKEVTQDSNKHRAYIDIRSDIKQSELNYGFLQRPVSKVFYTEIDEDLTVLKNELFLSAEKFHIGALTFIEDNQLIFTKTDISDDWNPSVKTHPRLFTADRVDTTLDNVKSLKLKSITPSLASGHPTISKDGNTLVFSSNLPGGAGGSDLYKVTKGEDGKWSAPENLSELNTSGDELFPQFDLKSNTLYFATDGMEGYGGLDIYSTEWNNGTVTKPTILPYPINSLTDDFSVVFLDSTKQFGFVVSDRIGGEGDEDIYGFKPIPPERMLKGIVKYEDGKLAPNALVTLQDNMNKELAKVRTDDSGKFSLEGPEEDGKFKLVATEKGLGDKKEITLSDQFDFTEDIILILTPAATAQGTILDEDGNPVAGALVELKDVDGNVIQSAVSDENGNYAFLLEDNTTYTIKGTKDDLTGYTSFTTDENYDSESDRNILLREHETSAHGTVFNPDGSPASNVIVEIKDNQGNLLQTVRTDENGNYDVSLAKDENYQIIATKDNLQAVENLYTGDNYDDSENVDLVLAPNGQESFAIVLNENSKEPIAGVEITLIDKKTNIKYSTTTDEDGKFNLNLRNNTDYTVNLKKDGYYPKSFDINIGDNQKPPIDLTKYGDFSMKYAGYSVDNIYYELDSEKLTEDSKKQLDKIAIELKNSTSAHVLIKSYADCRGRDKYNISLSWRRSKAAKTYLMDQGIPEARILTESLGATNFVNNCNEPQKCTEAEHALNRRSEFEIIE